MNLNERQLTYLIEVAQHGTLSGAAVTLGIDQPSLSRYIKQMERDVGDALFHRTGRGVHPTEVGLALLEIARRYVNDLNDLRNSVQEKKDQPRGSVSLGAVQLLGENFAPSCLLKYRIKRPNVLVHLAGGSSDLIQEMLLSGRLDLGLVYDAGLSSDLIAQPIMTEELVIMASHGPHTKKLGNGKVTLASVADLPLILPGRRHGLRRAVDYAARQAGVRLNIAYEVDSLATIKALVRQGDCFAILPFSGVATEIRENKCQVFQIVEPNISTAFSMAIARNRPSARVAEEFTAFVRQEIGKFTQEMKLFKSRILGSGAAN